MERVFLIKEFYREVTGNLGTYPWNGGSVVGVASDEKTAIGIANGHIKREINDARSDITNVDAVEVYHESATSDELKMGIVCMKVTEDVEPHKIYEYGIKIEEWSVAKG